MKALVFDTFGTVVDWRSSIAKEIEDLGDTKRLHRGWREVRRCLARRLRPEHEPRPHRRAAVDQARRPASDDPRQDSCRLQDHRTLRRRDRCAQSRVASAAAVAGRGRRADAVEEEVHDRAVVERQHRPDDGDGETFRIAVGLHSRRRAGAPLQARSRGLPVRGRLPRSRARRSDDGRGPPGRSARRQGARVEDRVRGEAARIWSERQA